MAGSIHDHINVRDYSLFFFCASVIGSEHSGSSRRRKDIEDMQFKSKNYLLWKNTNIGICSFNVKLNKSFS